MHHAHARDHRKVVAVEIEVDLILNEAAKSVAPAVGFRLHDFAVDARDRRLAERALGFGGAGVEPGAQVVAANGFRQRGLNTPGVGIVVGVDRFHRSGGAVRHPRPVMGLGVLVVDFGRHTVEIVIHWRPVVFQADAPATSLAGLIGIANDAVAAAIPAVKVGVVGFMVVVERAGQLVFIIWLPDAGGHKGIGVPVGRIGVNLIAVILGFLAVAAAVDENAA